MIRFEVTGDSMAEFRTQFAQAIGAFMPMLTTTAPAPTVEQATASVQEQPKEEAKSDKVKPAKAKDKPKQIDLEEKIAETAAKITIEDLRGKLKALGEKKGHDAVFKLLEDFGAKNASSVPAEKYADVVAQIDKTLEG